MLSRRSLALAFAAAAAPRWKLACAASTSASASASASTSTSTSTSSGSFVFPRDFGAHPESRIEWWYVTGALQAAARLWGFQITFFRAATGIAGAASSRFQAGQVVFAHAAITDLEQARLRHDQRIARSGFGIAEASSEDTLLRLRGWQLVREPGVGPSRYRAVAASDSAGFRFDLALDATQAVLMQGVGGLSQKGPDAAQASRYYSEPQLAVRGTLGLDGGRPIAVSGRAWLDHEWSDSLLAPDAVGWDWIGMNLDDGSALTAFRLRRADGNALWAGGSFRPAGGATRNFAAGDVFFAAGRRWTSPASKASYPVQWTVTTPAGRFGIEALLDDQELDSRASTGAIYWEGLARLVDAGGRPVGRGYLEMTGYASRLVI
jgi:predicted secreted hydrolase